jgi:hypothetical protein
MEGTGSDSVFGMDAIGGAFLISPHSQQREGSCRQNKMKSSIQPTLATDRVFNNQTSRLAEAQNEN